MIKIIRPHDRRDDDEPTALAILPADASVGKRWKFRRNAVIAVAHHRGISQRCLADVFDLPRSRVATIIEELSGPRGARPVGDRPPAPGRSMPALPPGASASKRWRFRRNTVISVAHRNGFSQRALADVFDLPRSRIASIVKEFSAHEDTKTKNSFE